MGDLIATALYSEIIRLVEVLNCQGVTPHDLEVLSGASPWSRRVVGRVHCGDRFLWAMLEMEQSLEKAGFREDDFRRLARDPDKLQQVLKVAREGIVTAGPIIDSIIRIDRSVKPSYQDWVKEVLHLELEGTGPTEYDVAKLKQWLHKGQKGGTWVKGQVIYEYLKEKKMLESCLGLTDLLAIEAKGIEFFRQHFADKVVFGWKSVVRDRIDNLHAPYLYEYGDKVVLIWDWLENDWCGDSPALLFAS